MRNPKLAKHFYNQLPKDLISTLNEDKNSFLQQVWNAIYQQQSMMSNTYLELQLQHLIYRTIAIFQRGRLEWRYPSLHFAENQRKVCGHMRNS